MEFETEIRMEAGKPLPRGAHWDGQGVNFSLVSPGASAVTLCLFDETGKEELAKLPMSLSENGVWCAYLRGAKPGLV